MADVHAGHIVHRRSAHVHIVDLVRPGYVHIARCHRAHGRHRPVHRSRQIIEIVPHVIRMGLRSVVSQRAVHIVQRRSVQRAVGRYMAVHVIHIHWSIRHVIGSRHGVHRRAQGSTHGAAHIVAHVVHRATHRPTVHVIHWATHRWTAQLRITHMAHVHMIVHGIHRTRRHVWTHVIHGTHAAHGGMIHGGHGSHVIHVIGHC